jgi:hypothetical protein
MINITNKTVGLIAILMLGIFPTFAQMQIDLESGANFKGPYNNIQVPKTGGTDFDAFGNDFNTDPSWFYRIRAGYTIKGRHTITALFAPLTIESFSKSTNNQLINFEGVNFEAQKNLKVRYKFNSYRLTYRYNIVKNDNLTFGLGITGKVRDAAIQLTNDVSDKSKTDLGVVPLINFYLSWNFLNNFGLLVDGDALYIPGFTKGRAEDIFVGLRCDIDKNMALKGGYRFLEGGSDIDVVKNFTFIHYASLGVIFTFLDK